MQANATTIAKPLFDKGFFSASSIIFAGSFVVNILNYIFTLIMSRLLGVPAFGEVAAMISLLTIIAVPSSALAMLMTREVAFRSASGGDEVRNLFLFLRKHILIAAFGFWVLFLAVAPLLSYFLHIPYLLFAAFSLILPFSIAGALQSGTLQGLQEFFTLSKQNVLGAVIKLAIAILLVLAGFSVLGVVIALVCAQGATWLFGYLATKSTLDLSRDTSRQPMDARPLRLFFSVTLITTFLLALLSNTDLLLAKHFLPETLAGEYGGLFTLGNIIIYGIGAFTTVLLPMASSAHAKGNGGERYILGLSMAVIAVAAFVAWALFSLFPGIIIGLLFGARYLSVAPVLGRYAIAEGCIALSLALINYFVAVGNKSFLYMLGIGILAEVALIWFNHASILAITTMLAASSVLLLVLMASNYFFTTKPRTI
jgi:O-antigen/teichoic acid export membrane protein